MTATVVVALTAGGATAANAAVQSGGVINKCVDPYGWQVCLAYSTGYYQHVFAEINDWDVSDSTAKVELTGPIADGYSSVSSNPATYWPGGNNVVFAPGEGVQSGLYCAKVWVETSRRSWHRWGQVCAHE